MKANNFLIVGVGGQGVLLASNVLAEVGVESGYDVKKAEIHGMSQRGGSVNSHVRWANCVKSPVIGKGEVDYLVSLEKLETLRYLEMLRDNGHVLIGEFRIPPLTVSSGDEDYPDDDLIRESVGQVTEQIIFVPSMALAKRAGTARAHNVVLIGALSALLKDISTYTWEKVIDILVPPKYVSINQAAFKLGREFVLERL
jgi:indolepyruvate ferredoxin oxidoreductase beta subunit